MHVLAAKRILVVEDTFLIALMVSEALDGAGALVVGPVQTLREGLALAQAEPLDAAVLDINLRGEFSDPIAAALQQRGIPFVVATGYGEQHALTTVGAPVLRKPYTGEQLLEVVSGLLARTSPA